MRRLITDLLYDLLIRLAARLAPDVGPDPPPEGEFPRGMRTTFYGPNALSYRSEVAMTLLDNDVLGWVIAMVRRRDDGTSYCDYEIALEAEAWPGMAAVLGGLSLAAYDTAPVR